MQAVEYRDAAQVLLTHDTGEPSYSAPRAHLLGMAAELALKAFLRSRGLSADDLKGRRLGHDISELLSEAVSLGLAITEYDASVLCHMDLAHREHFNRYGFKCTGAIETIFTVYDQTALGVVSDLISSVNGRPIDPQFGVTTEQLAELRRKIASETY